MEAAKFYSIRYTESAAQFLRESDARLRVRISTKIATLARNPFPPGNRKLKGAERAFRIRIGDYRVVYDVLEDVVVVLVLRIGHRKDVYR
jgi:mRNA interferase RelE/StbE